jgi:amino-acid N-acetyltransferase
LLVIDPDYRKGNRGERIIKALELSAKKKGLTSLFLLTTISGHWFIEQGFIETSLEQLPEGKKQMYNFQRNSKVFMKNL